MRNHQKKHQHYSINQQIKETLIVILVGTVGAMCMVAMLIGAAIQTSERMDMEVLSAEVDR